MNIFYLFTLIFSLMISMQNTDVDLENKMDDDWFTFLLLFLFWLFYLYVCLCVIHRFLENNPISFHSLNT